MSKCKIALLPVPGLAIPIPQPPFSMPAIPKIPRIPGKVPGIAVRDFSVKLAVPIPQPPFSMPARPKIPRIPKLPRCPLD